MEVLPLIGLEVHVELATASKMFCSCSTKFGAPPNSQVCPVCMGMPGVLPVMNGKAVELALVAAAALDCRIASFTKWDRKSYYYPDLPKNYQISQYDLPLASGGHLEVQLPHDTTRKIGIIRVHLEEDAGKLSHADGASSEVDLNRAGQPLMEIVSEPDMNTVEEVMAFARALHGLVRWLGVSEANMEMGHMRFEPNVNLHITRDSRIHKTPITEVKNLNSFRSLERTVTFEIDRQRDEWESNPDEYTIEKHPKSNRGYDEATGTTVHQRSKEEAHDYRYFPEPDLVPVRVSDAWRDSLRKGLPELPMARQRRFMSDFELSAYDASVLVADRDVADYFEAAVSAGADPKPAANWITTDVMGRLNEKKIPIARFPVTAAELAGMIALIADGTISTKIAREDVFPEMVAGGVSAKEIVEKKGLKQISDTGELEALVDKVVVENPKAAEDVKAGKKNAVSFLVGQIMKATKGQANPGAVSKLIVDRLKQ